jgi:hypothetical protein
MPALTSRGALPPAVRLPVTIVLALLVAGCGGQSANSVAASTSTSISTEAATSTTVAPTTTGPGPLTAKELAWLAAAKKLESRIEKSATETQVFITRAKLLSYARTLRACSSELRRIGTPSARLLPVHALVKQACQQLDKGAKCYATAAGAVDAGGAVVAGSPQERIFNRASECGLAGQGNGLNLLVEAVAKGDAIKAAAG